MKISVSGNLGVVDGATRADRVILKAGPAKGRMVGRRYKFDLSQFSATYARLNFPNAEFSNDFPTTVGAKGTSRRGVFKYATEPYEHQELLFKQTRALEYFGFFWEMGLGKTKEALDTAAWLYHEGLIDSLLVITYNGVHLNWTESEVPKHLHENCEHLALAWNSGRYSDGTKYYLAQLDTLSSHKGLQVLSMNIEAFARDKAFNYAMAWLKSRNCMVVIDESHAIKDPRAKRTKKILKLRPFAKYRRVMTGTPTGGNPLDVYTQMAFLTPEILGFKSFYVFQSRYAVMAPLGNVTSRGGRQVKIVVGYRDVEELQGLLTPHSDRRTKLECLDLPPKISRRHPFVLNDEQRRIYTQLVEDTVAEFAGERIAPGMAMTRLMRLHQITCGFIVTDDAAARGEDEIQGVPISDGPHPRLVALMQDLEKVQGKAIVWSTYRYSMREIYNAVIEVYGEGSAVGYSGATPIGTRPGVVKRFQEDPNTRFFIGQPKAGGYGITLTAANDVLYYSNGYSLIVRLQSEDRPHRIGQEFPVTYTDLEAVNTVDGAIIETLKQNLDVAAQITGDKLVEWLSI